MLIIRVQNIIISRNFCWRVDLGPHPHEAVLSAQGEGLRRGGPGPTQVSRVGASTLAIILFLISLPFYAIYLSIHIYTKYPFLN